MKKAAKITCCFIVLLLFAAQNYADDTARKFLDGVQSYNSGDYAAAISAFSGIIESGVINSKLFYNLGNAYLKNGDIGRAMLWYERSLKLNPDDPELKSNYEYALSLVKDEKEESVSMIRIFFFWKNMLSAEYIKWIAVVLNLIFWLFLIVRTIQKKKNVVKTPAYVLLILTLIFTLTAFYNTYESAYISYGIILPSEVSVRSGLGIDTTELFVLHAGTKVRIEKEKDGFFRIRFSEGKIGWVSPSDIGVI